jgi:hypothetical protein
LNLIPPDAAAYLSDFPNAKAYRTRLMESDSLEEGLAILHELASLEDRMQILCAEMAAHSCELLLKWRRCDNLID